MIIDSGDTVYIALNNQCVEAKLHSWQGKDCWVVYVKDQGLVWVKKIYYSPAEVPTQ